MGFLVLAAGLAWGVRGQTVPDDYSHETVIEASVNPDAEWVSACDTWYDGKVWMATTSYTVSEGLQTTIEVYGDADLSAPPVFLAGISLASQFPAIDQVWANDLACGEPTFEYLKPEPGTVIDDFAWDASIAYTVGGLQLLISEELESSGGDTASVGRPRTHGWMFTKRYAPGHTPQWQDPVSSQYAIRTFVPVGTGASHFVENYAVDVLPDLTLVTQDEMAVEGPFPWSVAVGGAFAGEAQFEGSATVGHPPTADTIGLTSDSGSQDGFVVLMEPHINRIWRATSNPDPSNTLLLWLHSSGADAVRGVSFDQASGRLIVCGYYGDEEIDFDPDEQSELKPAEGSYQGGTDLFVASYTCLYGDGPLNPFEGVTFKPNWLYTWGTPDDDSAEAVAADVTGWVFFTGHAGDDVVVGGVGPQGPSGEPAMWQHVIGNTGIDGGTDVAVDGIGRPVVTGFFEGTVDFDPDESATTLTSAGGRDVFTARYHPVTGALEWAFKVGDADDDMGLGVAVDQYDSARVVHCGYFRGQPDFDPGPGVAIRTTTGIEGFTNVFKHTPGLSDLHVTFLLDANELKPGFGSLEMKDPVVGDADYRRLGVAEAIESEVPLGGAHKTVSMQLVMYGSSHYGHDTDVALLRRGTVQLIPPTVLTASTRGLFAARLNAIGSHHAFGTDQRGNLGDGLRLATDLMADARYAQIGGTTRHALVVTGEGLVPFGAFPNYLLSTARAEAVDAGGTSPVFDLIHGLANASGGASIGRAEMVGDVALSSDALLFPPLWSTAAPPGERHCGMAAEAPAYEEWSGTQYVLGQEYAQTVAHMIARCAHLLGDYDRDGVVEITFTGTCFNCTNTGATPCGEDWEKFMTDAGNFVPYADWNFDLEWDGHEGPPQFSENIFGIDFSKFFTGALGGCP